VTGLRRKPRWLRLLAWFLWANVLGMPLQAMVLFGHPPTEAVAVWAKLTPQNQLVMALSALAALGVQRVSRWGWYAALAFGAVALWNNAVVLRYPTPMPPWTVFAASACLGLGCAGFLLPGTFRLFHTPALHWWRAAPRFRLAAEVDLETGEGRLVRGSLFDISRTGVFVEVEAPPLQPGEVLRVRVFLGDRVLRCAGRVVRQTGGGERHPEGVGLRFARLPLADRFWLRVGLPEAAAA